MSLPTFEQEHAPELTDAQKAFALKLGQIIYLHCRGERTARKSEVFEKTYKISGSTFRAMVRHLRRNDAKIVSSGRGYFWAETEDEWQKCKAHIRARRDSLTETLNEMEGLTA